MQYRFLVFVLPALFVLTMPISSCAGMGRPVVQATVNKPWTPYYTYPDGLENKPSGLFAELVDILFTRELGMEVEQLRLPWKRAQSAVEVGDADFMVTISTPARDEYAYTTIIPLHRMFLHLYTYADHPKADQIVRIRTAEDIRRLGLTLAANLGDSWYEANIAEAGIRTHYISNDGNIAKFVAAKRADGMLGAVLATDKVVEDLGLQSRLTLTNVRFGPLDFHVLISRKSELMKRAEDINAALLRMWKSGVFERLTKKYGARLPY